MENLKLKKIKMSRQVLITNSEIEIFYQYNFEHQIIMETSTVWTVNEILGK